MAKAYQLRKESFDDYSQIKLWVDESTKCLQVPREQLIPKLKEWAAVGALYWEGAKLLADFFSRLELYFRLKVEGELVSVEACARAGKQDFLLSDCQAVFRAAPPCLIRRHCLKVFDCETPWAWLKWAWEEPERIITVGEAAQLVQKWTEEELIYECEGQLPEKTASPSLEVFPVLRLSDPRGAFATLWMDYGEASFPYHLPVEGQRKRDRSAEEAWEEDFLQSGFLRKTVGESQYYCPVDQVGRSLSFLLELGWRVYDHEGRLVCPQGQVDLEVIADQQTLHIKGKVAFGEYEAAIQDVVGSFNRREHFVQLGQGRVGLLDEGTVGERLSSLAEEGTLVGEGLVVAKNKIGAIVDGFPELRCDETFERLKVFVESFVGISNCVAAEGFCGELRPYQQTGLNWLYFLADQGFSGLLADDMGLGKTVQVLALLSHWIGAKKPILIVVPTSLLFHWRDESARFLPSARVYTHHGPGRNWEAWAACDIVLTTYGTLRVDVEFTNAEWQAVILDEAQQIKNPDSKGAQRAYQLRGDFRLCITGTPVENHLGELWSLFHFLMPGLLGKRQDFDQELSAGESDFRYLQRVKATVKPFLLRRRKEEVAPDLPPKIEQVVRLEMDEAQRKVYEDFLAGLKGGLLKKVAVDGVSAHRMEVFEAILRLRQICCHPLLVDSLIELELERSSSKWRALFMDVETLVDAGEKVLIYSQFTKMLGLFRNELKERGWKHVYLDGQTKNREGVVRQFQEDPETQIFLISLKAGGVGLNLTAADAVLLYDPWWNQAVEEQAIDRAHRIGRQGTVVAKRYITVDSIEEKMQTLKAAKQQVSQAVLDIADEALNLTMSDLEYLLQ